MSKQGLRFVRIEKDVRHLVTSGRLQYLTPGYTGQEYISRYFGAAFFLSSWKYCLTRARGDRHHHRKNNIDNFYRYNYKENLTSILNTKKKLKETRILNIFLFFLSCFIMSQLMYWTLDWTHCSAKCIRISNEVIDVHLTLHNVISLLLFINAHIKEILITCGLIFRALDLMLQPVIECCWKIICYRDDASWHYMHSIIYNIP